MVGLKARGAGGWEVFSGVFKAETPMATIYIAQQSSAFSSFVNNVRLSPTSRNYLANQASAESQCAIDRDVMDWHVHFSTDDSERVEQACIYVRACLGVCVRAHVRVCSVWARVYMRVCA